MRQSLSDELQTHVQFQHEFRDGCLLVITETWLSDRDLDTELAIDGFDMPVMGLACPCGTRGGCGSGDRAVLQRTC